MLKRAREWFTRIFCTAPRARASEVREAGVAAQLRVEKDRLVVHMPLQATDRESLQIRIDCGRLVISGERRIEQVRSEGCYRIVRCMHRSFLNEMRLPHRIDVQRSQARYHQGLLLIDMPCLAQERCPRGAESGALPQAAGAMLELVPEADPPHPLPELDLAI